MSVSGKALCRRAGLMCVLASLILSAMTAGVAVGDTGEEMDMKPSAVATGNERLDSGSIQLETNTTNETVTTTTTNETSEDESATETNETDNSSSNVPAGADDVEHNESDTETSRLSDPLQDGGASATGDNSTEKSLDDTNRSVHTESTQRAEETVEKLDTTLSLDGESYALEIDVYPNGDYAVAGLYQDLTQGYVARVSPDGSVKWIQDIGLDTIEGLTMVDDGSVVVVGDRDTEETPHLYRVGGSGSIQYATAPFVDTAYTDVTVRDGTIYAVGVFQGGPIIVTHDLTDGIDDSADSNLIGSNGALYGITQTNDGFVTVGARGDSAYAVKFRHETGPLQVVWEESHNGQNSQFDVYGSVVQTPANDVIALGSTQQSEDEGGLDNLVTKFDADSGTVLGDRQFGSAADDRAYDIVRVGDRIVALTYPGVDQIDDGRVAKATQISSSDGSLRVIGEGANEGDVFTAGTGKNGNELIIGAAESPDVEGSEFGEFDTGILRLDFVNNSDETITAQNGLAVEGDIGYVVTDGQIQTVDLTTQSVINSVPAPQGDAKALAYGDGSLWFADGVSDTYDGEIIEVDPETGEVRSRIDVGYDVTALAYGDGSLWATDITFNNIGEFSSSGEQVSSFDVRDATGTTSPQSLAYFDGTLWLGTGDTNGLYKFGTDGTFKEQVSQRETPYQGLAANETALLGGDADGDLTVLETREPVAAELNARFPTVEDGQISATDSIIDVTGSAAGADRVLFVAIGSEGSIVTRQLAVDSSGTISRTTVDVEQLATGQVNLHVIALGRDGDVGDGSLPGQYANSLTGLENYLVMDLGNAGYTADEINSALLEETVFAAGSDDLRVSRDVEITTAGETSALSVDRTSRTVSAGEEFTLTYTVNNTWSQPRNILLELTSLPDPVSITEISGDVSQNLSGSTPPGVVTTEVAADDAATVQVTFSVAEDAAVVERALTARSTITSDGEVVASESSTTTLSITEKDPIVARFGGDDGEVGNLDVLEAVNAANSNRQIGGEPVSNLDILELVNRINQ